jgi:hypothetical protein
MDRVLVVCESDNVASGIDTERCWAVRASSPWTSIALGDLIGQQDPRRAEILRDCGKLCK